MSIVLANGYKPKLLGYKLPYIRAFYIRLFQNDWVPQGTDIASNYLEATFSGYVAQNLSDLGPPYLNDAGQGESDTCPHLWTCTDALSPNLIYGYFVTDLSGVLVWADRGENAPVPMQVAGAVYSLAVRFLEDTLSIGNISYRS